MIRKQRSIAVENLVVSASIGIYPHEHEAPQRVRLSFDAEVALPDSLSDDFSNVLSYEVFVHTAQAMVQEGHFNLLETLVDDLADTKVQLRELRRRRAGGLGLGRRLRLARLLLDGLLLLGGLLRLLRERLRRLDLHVEDVARARRRAWREVR
ncbi:MAG: dihydroneopterin aldolase, partial [Alphaproteobacteria bacterium]